MSSPPGKKRRRVLESSDEDEALSDPPPMPYLAAEEDQIDENVHSDGSLEGEGSRGHSENDSDGEDLMDNIANDYQAIPQLDQFDDSLLDNRKYENLDMEARMEVERRLRERDRDRGGVLSGLMEEGESEDEADRRDRRAKFGLRDEEMDGDDEAQGDSDEDNAVEVNLEAFHVPLRQWLSKHTTRQEVKRRFSRFLKTFQGKSSAPIYPHKIREMCSANLASVEVSYLDLSKAVPQIAVWLADEPKDMLQILDEVANKVVLQQFPEYQKIQDEVHVRIADLPIIDKLRDLREVHLHTLIKVHGVVTRRFGVYPQLKLVKYNCVKCLYVIGPLQQTSVTTEVRPGSCPHCQSPGPFRMNQEETVYRNYQKVVLQEAPGSVPPGRVPRSRTVILLADLIDRARPGEEIEVTGIYTNSYDAGLSHRSGFPVFSTLIEANFLQKKEDLLSVYTLTEEDKRAIQQLAKTPGVARKIIASIAPSIYGHQHIKTAIALSLFGGVAKNVNNKHRIRGDINVLLLGDPGTAKSQVLKYCEKTAPRAVYTTGKGASAVGLTAGVHKDHQTGEWTLEGGALVLADKGVCLIDEFDKMSERDRTSIHEAMEQQSISVSKAGIVTSLQARCAVIAAANPIGGRYDASLTLAENVELTDPILQRFDCLCVLQDTVDPVADEQLASFVVDSHRRSHPAHRQAQGEQEQELGQDGGGSAQTSRGHDGPISQQLLRKYIMYARTYCNPKLHSIDQEKVVANLYADLRRESMSSGGVPIAVRHVESIMRMAEANARMHLRSHVRDDDVDSAIATLLESFIQAQKFSVRRSLQRGFQKYLTQSSDFFDLLLHELQELIRIEQTYQQLKHGAPQAGCCTCSPLDAAFVISDWPGLSWRPLRRTRWKWMRRIWKRGPAASVSTILKAFMPPSSSSTTTLCW
ncbi:unnamed protein product [Chrysoparadoxa australica]